VRLLLTNDDGIDAPGLAALVRAASGLGEVLVAAPVRERSGCGHQVTTHAPIAIEPRGGGRWAIHGTPADCVRVALDHLGLAPDWILSGINPGGNLGTDVYHSGTVAAVREAALHGRPGIAVSHYHRRGLALDWARAADWTAVVLGELMAAGCAPGRYLNVNLPHPEAGAALPARVRAQVDPSPLPLRFTVEGGAVRYAGDYHQRRRVAGSDVTACFGGSISVSELAL
jgi:5'-nucleotidase